MAQVRSYFCCRQTLAVTAPVPCLVFRTIKPLCVRFSCFCFLLLFPILPVSFSSARRPLLLPAWRPGCRLLLPLLRCRVPVLRRWCQRSSVRRVARWRCGFRRGRCGRRWRVWLRFRVSGLCAWWRVLRWRRRCRGGRACRVLRFGAVLGRGRWCRLVGWRVCHRCWCCRSVCVWLRRCSSGCGRLVSRGCRRVCGRVVCSLGAGPRSASALFWQPMNEETLPSGIRFANEKPARFSRNGWQGSRSVLKAARPAPPSARQGGPVRADVPAIDADVSTETSVEVNLNSVSK